MKRAIGVILIVSGIVGTAILYKVGSDNRHLSELIKFYWAPLPLAVIGLFMIAKKKE